MALMAFICLTVYFGGILYIQKELVKIKTSHEDIESEIYKKERIKALETLVMNNTDSIENLRNFFVRKDDEVKFIEYIEGTAKISGVDFEISTITSKTEEIGIPKEDILVRVAVRGAWNSVMKFIDTMEKGNFGVLIREVEMDNNSSGGWFASILLNFYKEI